VDSPADCFFATDLHGRPGRYRRLWDAVRAERPGAVFLGGDLLPHAMDRSWQRHVPGEDFLQDVLVAGFARLRDELRDRYPRVFVIPGNDDPAACEPDFLAGQDAGLWTWLHGRRDDLGGRIVLGYACVPPTPFQLKDYERYDVSRFVDPGCVPPDAGRRTVAVDERAIRHATIAGDLQGLVGDTDLAGAVCLFHSPPYRTALDRAALDGQQVDHAPLDVHVGSIAIRRFLERRQPAVALCGHVHEAVRLTGRWREQIGATWCLGGAHDGPELALVRFDPARPDGATRELLPV